MANRGKKTAVVLFNLGGPGAPEDIEPFLRNFFRDKNIIALPAFIRLPLARIIAWRRARNQSNKSYGALGGKSPLLDNTRAQAGALQAALGPDFRVFVSMRYWHPMADEVARTVKEYAPDEIVLLPLYPQYSTTTTKSSFEDWDRAVRAAGLHVPTRRTCCYPLEAGFVSTMARLVREQYDRAVKDGHKIPRVLFSAHGLPEKVIRAGDPYQRQCEESAPAIAAAAGIPQEGWRICYQSKVGPLEWIGPPVEDEIARAGREGVAVIVCPHAFVSEHVETLVDIDIEFRRLARESGVPAFYRTQTAGTAPEFIAGLARLARGGEEVKQKSACPAICGMRERAA